MVKSHTSMKAHYLSWGLSGMQISTITMFQSFFQFVNRENKKDIHNKENKLSFVKFKKLHSTTITYERAYLQLA